MKDHNGSEECGVLIDERRHSDRNVMPKEAKRMLKFAT